MIHTVNVRIFFVFRCLQRISTGEADPLADLRDEEDGWRSGVLRRDDVVDTDEGDGDEDQLPEHIYDVDKVLANTPLLRKDNAFHDTLNSECVVTWSISARAGPVEYTQWWGILKVVLAVHKLGQGVGIRFPVFRGGTVRLLTPYPILST